MSPRTLLTTQVYYLVGYSLCLLGAVGWLRQPTPGRTPPTFRALPEPMLVSVPGLQQVLQVSGQLYSGSSPESAEAFAALQKLGVRTVLSVDGAQPKVALAKQYGLSYVHLPIEYAGIERERVLALANAVRTLPGPIYLHCHHGKHRGPTAACAIQLCLDPTYTPEQAVALLDKAGTDRRYVGLRTLPTQLRRPSSAELAQVPTDFPECTPGLSLVQQMVALDQRLEHLQLANKAGWRTPPSHPDLEPAHEALQLVEHYREASRLPMPSDEWQLWLSEALLEAEAFEQSLRKVSSERARLFERVQQACVRCHARYRDQPKLK